MVVTGQDLIESGVNLDVPEKNTNSEGVKLKQFDYIPPQARDLRIHLTTHSEEKSNKCNQCDYASFIKAL